MASARSVLDRMIKAMNRGEPVRSNVYADFKMKDIDVFAKPKRKTGNATKKPSTAKTFRNPVPKKKLVKKKLRRWQCASRQTHRRRALNIYFSYPPT